MSVPSSTYRLQVTPDRPLDSVLDSLDHLEALGVSHLYLSPLLTAAPGSTHGYDVIDHTTIAEELGGMAALVRLHEAAAARGMGLVLDIVPNHMGMPVPEYLNHALWSVLAEGPTSPFATWFDLDWSEERPLLLPVLGDRIDVCLDEGQITVCHEGEHGPVVCYMDHRFPVRPGTEALPLVDLLEAQHYRLAYWRLASEDLNYRRFFDVDTLVGLRVEDPKVFAATHELILELVRSGVVQGLRVDHPDGLADPREYLSRLREPNPSTWVVVEKILEGDEDLPDDWSCSGTTGYEAAARIHAVFLDPAGEPFLRQSFSEETGELQDFPAIAVEARREVLSGVLASELDRLAEVAYTICQGSIRLRDHSRRGLTEALVELLVHVPVYRVYVHPGEKPSPAAVATLTDVAAECARLVPARSAEIEVIRDLALGRHGRSALTDEFVLRFQQTCGPAIAKGVEDTACFRWFPLVSLAEVGSDPDVFGIPDADIHRWADGRARRWPAALTTTSTHDTKRSEDVRARLAVLSEIPTQWLTTMRAWRQEVGPLRDPSGDPDPQTEWFLWQTLVGAWPLDAQRLGQHLVKAAREAKRRTSWTEPDLDYERGLETFVEALFGNDGLVASVAQTVDSLHRGFVTNVLGQRTLAMFLPGVPDVYQGCEIVNLRLTDPDNRTPPDHAAIAEADVRASADVDPWADVDAAKLHLTRVGLTLRREHPNLVEASTDYRALTVDGVAAAHVFGFSRADVCVSVTRRALRLATAGGLGDTALHVPEGEWRDAVTGLAHVSDGRLEAGAVHASWPVAVLTRADP